MSLHIEKGLFSSRPKQDRHLILVLDMTQMISCFQMDESTPGGGISFMKSELWDLVPSRSPKTRQRMQLISVVPVRNVALGITRTLSLTRGASII